MILGEDLPHDRCTVFYRDVDFIVQSLHMSYSQFMKLPTWERRMLLKYNEIKADKEEKSIEAMKLHSKSEEGVK